MKTFREDMYHFSLLSFPSIYSPQDAQEILIGF